MIDTFAIRDQARSSAWLRTWHRRLGVALMLLFCIASLSGVVLVYRDAILRVTVAAPVQNHPSLFTTQQLAEDIATIQARYQEANISYIKAPHAGRPFWTLVDTESRSALLTPRSLEPLTTSTWLLGAFDWLRALHVDLLMGTTGKIVLVLLGALGVFFVVSGLVLWWPVRKRLRLRHLIPRRFKRGPLIISHRNLGALMAPLIALSFFTGAFMLGKGLWNQWVVVKPAEPTAETVPAWRGSTLSMGELLLVATQALPEGQITVINLPNPKTGLASFRMRLPGEWHPNGRTFVRVNAADGVVPAFQRADQLPTGTRFTNLMYPLHSSYGMNGVFQLLVLVAGVGLLWLSISGVIAWAKKNG